MSYLKITEMIDFREHFRCKFRVTEPNYLSQYGGEYLGLWRSTKILISEIVKEHISDSDNF
jgi:hypothetical protein